MKRDIKKFRYICRKHKMSAKQRREFSRYIHKLKRQGNGGTGPNGDFTPQELDQLAEEFLGN